MPYGQMTLDDVVKAGQEGVAWGEQQEQIKRQREAQQIQQQAEQAFKSVFEQDQVAHIQRGGSPQDYKPNDQVYLRAAEARGLALAKAGDFKGVLQNSAAVEQQRMRIRSAALNQYGIDRDFGTFAKTFYSTIPDGAEVVGYEEVPGGPADAPKGAPSGKNMVRLKVKRGDKVESKLVDPDAMLKEAQMMMMDRAKIAEQMVKLDYLRALDEAKTDGRVKVETTRGEQTRETVRERGVQTLAQIGARNEGNLDVATTRADATVQAADRRARATENAAATRAGATVEAAGTRAAGGGGRDGAAGNPDYKAWEGARKDVDNARKILDREVNRATTTKIKDNPRSLAMTSEQKDALVNNDEGVKKARADLAAAQERAKRLADKAEGVRTLGDAAPSAPAAGPTSRIDQFKVLR